MAYCTWDAIDQDGLCYHDKIWGQPLHDDRLQFEFLSLEVMQCGLSWGLVWRKREIIRSCFDSFDFDKVALYGEEDVKRILGTAGMIRAPRKINAIINNASRFKEVRNEYGTFSAFIWSYTKEKTIVYNKHPEGYIPASNALSERISRDLKARGFKFLGPVVIYSHLQAAGLINDHAASCPVGRQINERFPIARKRREGEKNVAYYG